MSLEHHINVLAKPGEADVKVASLHASKAAYEAHKVPEEALDSLTFGLKTSVRQSNAAVLSAALTVLPLHLEAIAQSADIQHHLKLALASFLVSGGLIDRIGDGRSSTREQASTSLVELGVLAYRHRAENLGGSSGGGVVGKRKEEDGHLQVWERAIKEGLMGKNGKGKEAALHVIERTRARESIPLRGFLPVLVDLLEDGDGQVRETARETVLNLFSTPTTSPLAKAELKKIMTTRGVRKTIMDAIIPKVFGTSIEEKGHAHVEASTAAPEPVSNGNGHAGPEVVEESTGEIEVVYIASDRDLEAEFASMFPPFEGRESEHNWLLREKSVNRVRGMLKGDVFARFPDTFLHLLRSSWMEASLKALGSLRTTLCTATCFCYIDLASALRTAFDPLVEIVLLPLSKMANFTKNLVVAQTQQVIQTILLSTSPQPRLILPFLTLASADKTPRARSFAQQHLKTYVDHHGSRSHARSTIEASNGVDVLEKVLKTGLGDPAPVVKVEARLAWGSFIRIWAERGRRILEGLEGVARKALEKANPDLVGGSGGGLSAGSSPPGAGAAGGSGIPPPRPKRMGMAAQIAAQRKLKEAKERELAASSNFASLDDDHYSPPTPSPSNDHEPHSTPTSTSIPSVHPPSSSSSTSSSSSAIPSRPPRAVRNPFKPTSSLALASASSSRFSPAQSTSPPPAPSSLPPLPPATSREFELLNFDDDDLASTAALPPIISPALPASTYNPSNDFFQATPPRPTAAASAPIDFFADSPSIRNLGTQILQNQPSPPIAQLLPLPPSPPQVPTPTHQQQQASPSQSQSLPTPPRRSSSPLPASKLSPPKSNVSHSTSPPPPTSPRTTATSIPISRSPPRTPIQQTPLNALRSAALYADSPPSWRERPSPKHADLLREANFDAPYWRRSLAGLNTSDPRPSSSQQEHPSEVISRLEYSSRLSPPEPEDFASLIRMSASSSVDGHSPHPYSPLSPSTGASSSNGWLEQDVMERLVSVLQDGCRGKWPDAEIDWSLGVLESLLKHQRQLLESYEAGLCDVLLELRTASRLSHREASTILINLLGSNLSPIDNLNIMTTSLRRFSTSRRSTGGDNGERSIGFGFGLLCVGKSLMELPSEIVEEELPRLRDLILPALESPHLTIRESAATCCLASQLVLRDEAKLFGLLDGLSPERKNLLTYLFDKNRVREGAGEGGRERVEKEMRRLSMR